VHSVKLTSQSVTVKCPGENRYIGYLYPWAPGAETVRSRSILLKIDGVDQVYRIGVSGRDARVKATKLSESRTRVAPTFYERAPTLNSPEQTRQWLKQREEGSALYRSIQWLNSEAVQISDINNSGDGGILSLTVQVKHGG
jgi:hypothetical protein